MVYWLVDLPQKRVLTTCGTWLTFPLDSDDHLIALKLPDLKTANKVAQVIRSFGVETEPFEVPAE